MHLLLCEDCPKEGLLRGLMLAHLVRTLLHAEGYSDQATQRPWGWGWGLGQRRGVGMGNPSADGAGAEKGKRWTLRTDLISHAYTIMQIPVMCHPSEHQARDRGGGGGHSNEGEAVHEGVGGAEEVMKEEGTRGSSPLVQHFLAQLDESPWVVDELLLETRYARIRLPVHE